jgi:hypothetical protein
VLAENGQCHDRDRKAKVNRMTLRSMFPALMAISNSSHPATETRSTSCGSVLLKSDSAPLLGKKVSSSARVVVAIVLEGGLQAPDGDGTGVNRERAFKSQRRTGVQR